NGWTSQQFKDAVTHDQSCPEYNSNVRQLLHVGYKVAAELENEYTGALEKYEDVIAGHVTGNIYQHTFDTHFMLISGELLAYIDGVGLCKPLR
ncbi:MAG: hypothetical protein U9P12_05770, partial [Verrucomicrobiota bacterium]|nr:hypothetical protein [Verrucomicrobiota bacterium]